MSETKKALTPAQQLAKRIADRLVMDGLLDENLAKQIESKVAQGQMQVEDWKLTFEKALDLHKREE